MYKKALAVLLVVLMLVMGGVKVKADHCEQTGYYTVGNCEGDNCYKNGNTGPHYISQTFYRLKCWTDGGREYDAVKPGERRKSGCC